MKMTIKEHILFILLMLVNGLNPIKGYREIKDEDFLKQLNSTPTPLEIKKFVNKIEKRQRTPKNQ